MDVTFKLADVADVGLLVELMGEFYEFDGLALDERAARSARSALKIRTATR